MQTSATPSNSGRERTGPAHSDIENMADTGHAERQERHGPMPTDVAPSDSDCTRTLSAHPGPEDAAASRRAQQVGGGVSGWIGDTFYDNDDDELVQNQDQPTGHDTHSEPPHTRSDRHP